MSGRSRHDHRKHGRRRYFPLDEITVASRGNGKAPGKAVCDLTPLACEMLVQGAHLLPNDEEIHFLDPKAWLTPIFSSG